MHARSAEVTQFLEKDLLPQVAAAFSEHKTADKTELEKELATLKAGIAAAGMNAAESPKVKELESRLRNEAVDVSALESDVYDHLFSFFRRYYSEGDFLAKRVYKAGVYAIPYEGEEVTLHWANKDQYYVKTAEYLRDYAFRLRPEDNARPMRVHFKLADVAEGEHGNVKAVEGKDRIFILSQPGASGRDFMAEEDGDQGKELVIRFEYRPATLNDWPDDARTGKTKPPSQKDMLSLAAKRVLSVVERSLAAWISELGKPHAPTVGSPADYSRLEMHLRRYSARNTFDYFIHKSLGAFLHRELDFYIKNEVMHLDDVENESALRVDQYLSKIKVIRRIASKIIDFLSQLEEFQKKLWLKKKFVVETNYCITLDRISVEFYSEIAANAAQRDEWKKLVSIDEVKKDLVTPGYSAPLTLEFLKANRGLVVDTAHFDVSFRDRVVASIDELESQTDGLVVHSNNVHAAELLSARYRGAVDTVYNDPPYNTDASEILYKNGYRNSSWCALIEPVTRACHALLSEEGVLCTTIDDQQVVELTTIVREVFGEEQVLGTVAVRSNPSGRITLRGLAQCHEYAIFASKTKQGRLQKLPRTAEQQERFDNEDPDGAFEWRNFRRDGSSSTRRDRPKQFFPIFATNEALRIPQVRWDTARSQYELLEQPARGEQIVWPVDSGGGERCWRWGIETAREKMHELSVKTNPQGVTQIYNKYRPNSEGVLPLTIWTDKKYSATEYGTGVVKNLFGGGRTPFDFPKSLHATRDSLHVASIGTSGVVLDCFGGSGTTGHAVLSLNRDDEGKRRYILVEMGAHFDTVLLPRLKKVIYSPDWKDGAPSTRTKSASHCFKYMRLESYEDALNNLETRRTESQQLLLQTGGAQGSGGLREQYVLRYMLDVETRASQSLLNVKGFADPTAYKLRVKRPGSDETREVHVDLVETFNWLIGHTVKHIAAPQTFSASFERDTERRLRLRGHLKQGADGSHWFRTVTGVARDGRKTLVIWRKLTDDLEKDNLVLDAWFTKQGYSAKDSEFGLIYVNGDNNLENLKGPDDTWKVRLIEEDFHRLMFEMERL
ncbi:MAG: site-specific DNA-methyltransferase [Myxococcaceae bacterium]|nr:site-specific DNA-methyltransferase [Myxococcaceae bacterium]